MSCVFLADAASKAAKVAKAVSKGVKTAPKKKIRSNPHFYRPKTLSLTRRAPTYVLEKSPKFDDFRVLQVPLTTEAALRKVEKHNTIVFLCDPEVTKPQIRAAISRRFNVNVVKCNTLIRPDGKKKAFIKLHQDHDALDLANKIGIL